MSHVEKQSFNLAPWLLATVALSVAIICGWLYFGASAAEAEKSAELSTAKQRFLTETNDLRSQLTKLQRTQNSVKDNTADLQNRLQQLNDQFETSKLKNQQQIDAHNKEVAKLKQTTHTTIDQTKFDALQETHTQLVAKSSDQATQLTEKINALTQTETELRDALNSAQISHQQLTTEKDGIAAQHDDLSSEFTVLHSKKNELESQLVSIHTENEMLSQTTAKLKTDLEFALDQSEQLKATNDALNTQLNNKNSEVTALTLRLEQQKTQLVSAHTAGKQLKIEYDILVSQHKSKESELDATKLTMTNLKEKLASLKIERQAGPSSATLSQEPSSDIIPSANQQDHDQLGSTQELSTPILEEKLITLPAVLEYEKTRAKTAQEALPLSSEKNPN